MRGKKAKALRAVARAETVGQKLVEYVNGKSGKKQVFTGKTDENGELVIKSVYWSCVTLKDTCTKAVYRGLKARYKKIGNLVFYAGN